MERSLQEREKQTERERGSERKRREGGRDGERETVCACSEWGVGGEGGGMASVCISKTVATHLVMVTVNIQHFSSHICYMFCNSVHPALFVTYATCFVTVYSQHFSLHTLHVL